MFTRKSIVFVPIIMLVFFLFASFGHSEITVDHDDFDGTTKYDSTFRNIGPWAELGFSLIDKKGSPLFPYMSFMLIQPDCYFFQKRDLDMKMDGDIISVGFVTTERHPERSAWGSCITMGGFGASPEQIKQIKDAEEITIRVYFKNKSDITWDVPDEVLNEWKELFEKAGL